LESEPLCVGIGVHKVIGDGEHRLFVARYLTDTKQIDNPRIFSNAKHLSLRCSIYWPTELKLFFFMPSNYSESHVSWVVVGEVKSTRAEFSESIYFGRVQWNLLSRCSLFQLSQSPTNTVRKPFSTYLQTHLNRLLR